MERLSKNKSTGVNGNGLRTWGLLFLAAGVIGRGVIQTHMLGIGQASAQQLLQIMDASDTAMMLTTLSLVLQIMETCAVPIFTLMLVTGVEHTSDFKAYFLRVAGLALLTEIPYNLALGGRILAFDSRNPVFGLVLCLILLYFYRLYAQSSFKNNLIKVVVTVAAVLWSQMLKIDTGACMVLVTAVLWAFRSKPLYRNFAGATMCIVCSLISPFFMAAPMGFLVVHLYNGEKGTNSRTINYLAYPAILLAAAVVGIVIS